MNLSGMLHIGFCILYAHIVISNAALSSDTFREEFITYEEFKNAVQWNGYPEPSEKKYDGFYWNLYLSGITTKEEAAMALSQFIWESGGLVAKRELVCIKSGCPGHYETRGCDIDGQRYFGRGYIQLTWCSNYRDASLGLFGNELLRYDPDMVARDDEIAWKTAHWYWRAHVHDRPGVAQGLFGVTTRAINGNQECDGPLHYNARMRFEIYKIVRLAFGITTEANERGCYPVYETIPDDSLQSVYEENLVPDYSYAEKENHLVHNVSHVTA